MKLVDPFKSFPTLAEQWEIDEREEADQLRQEEALEDLHVLIENMPSEIRGPVLLYLEAKKRLTGFLDELDSMYLLRLRFFERKKTKPVGETYRQRVDRLSAEIRERSDGI